MHEQMMSEHNSTMDQIKGSASSSTGISNARHPKRGFELGYSQVSSAPMPVTDTMRITEIAVTLLTRVSG